MGVNSQIPECYPGDDVVDIISRDMYPPEHELTSQSEMYYNLCEITSAKKITIIGETGTLPSPEAVVSEKVGWSSYMTWSKPFCLSEKFNTFEQLKKVYNSEYAVTKDTLPDLY